MDPLLAYVQSSRKKLVALIRELVECESPSREEAALARFQELVADRLTSLASIRTLPGGHLRCEFELPGKRKKGQTLVLGHSDTVWPLGTLARMPYREADGRLWGPGVLDMKAGIAFFVHAMRGLRELDVPVSTRVVLLLNTDEEVGSDSSRRFTEAEARRSSSVLVLEPGTGMDGKLKTARKGVGGYRVRVLGRAAHAGLDFERGANAVVELARQIERIAGFTNLARGITVSPGIIAGGSRTNVVPDEARLEIDVRVQRLRDAPALDRRFRSLRPCDKRCRIEVEGGLNRPPMERLPGTVQLFRRARKLAAELGVELAESLSGGGSDGNFTAALGVPTLDGLGAVGEGAHATHESILADRIDDRTALLGKLVAAL